MSLEEEEEQEVRKRNAISFEADEEEERKKNALLRERMIAITLKQLESQNEYVKFAGEEHK
ncbi:hypothetical protein MKW94_012824, partial [Papaver nudicaule]|nr:hypothetical protein [Papaver nudicaule]